MVKRMDAETAPLPARPPVRSIDASSVTRTQQNIVFVAAEAAPYSKTGGLGDVVGSLTIALAERGHRVMVVVPRYQTCARDRFLLRGLHDCGTWLRLDLGNGEHWVNFHHEARKGVDWVFVEHVSFERDGGLYGNTHGIYADNLFRCDHTLHLSARTTVPCGLTAVHCASCAMVATRSLWQVAMWHTRARLPVLTDVPHGVLKPDAAAACICSGGDRRPGSAGAQHTLCHALSRLCSGGAMHAMRKSAQFSSSVSPFHISRHRCLGRQLCPRARRTAHVWTAHVGAHGGYHVCYVRNMWLPCSAHA